MNILKRIIKGFFIWIAAMLLMYFVFSPIFPTGTKMPLPLSFFILLFPIFCAVFFSKTKAKKNKNDVEPNPPLAKQDAFIVQTPHQEYLSESHSRGSKNCEVVIFRKSQLQSSAKTYTVFLDGVQSGRLRNGGSISIKTSSGPHKLDFKGYWKMETSTGFSIPEFQQRTNIFTRVSLKTGKIFIENIATGKPGQQQSTEAKRKEATPVRPSSRSISLSYIDRMEGHDFEHFCADLLRKLGYERVQVTRGSGDQGVDVIAVKDGKKYAIQCKRYNQKLGNKPVQEVFAGKTIYGCNVGVVLTNNYFTDGAKEAAKATGVELWDRDTLRRMMVYAEERTAAQ